MSFVAAGLAGAAGVKTSGEGSMVGVPEALAEISRAESTALAQFDQAVSWIPGSSGFHSLGKMMIGRVANQQRAFLEKWPTKMRDPKTGRTIDLDTYSLEFLRAMSTFALDTLLRAQGKMGEGMERTLHWTSPVGKLTAPDVQKARDLGTNLSREISLLGVRIRAYTTAMRQASNEKKIAVRLPTYRGDIIKMFQISLQMEGLGWALALSSFGESIFNTLASITGFFKFVVDAAADLVATPLLFVGELLMKIAIGAAVLFGAYKIATREEK
jgi:hypothetical protein